MHQNIFDYNQRQVETERIICHQLSSTIDEFLLNAASRIWHGHPVWFLDGNPVVGYSKVKAGIKLLFWSGQSFDEFGLNPSGSFKAAEIVYTDIDQIQAEDVRRWLKKSGDIQWDYKNIVKRKGVLERLK
jgi:hypothetical protein